MKQLLLLAVLVRVCVAAPIPGRYIVELTSDPVAAHLLRTRSGTAARQALAGPEAARQRTLVQREQAIARAAIEQHRGKVLEQMDTAINALAVRISDADAASLASLPGVKNVFQEREVHMLLDRAVVLHRVPDAWSQVGFGSAGAGVKIGIIDSGIDVNHAAFADGSISAPAGFPRSDTAADQAFTNGKVLVARSYARLFRNPDPDSTARDHVGHGTATAMCAAGGRNSGPQDTITGVAPQAWLGNYKVFGTPGANDSTTDSAILKAIDDAVLDGMDVISLSLGYTPVTQFNNDPEVISLQRALSLGVIVVASAGNTGSYDTATVHPGSIASPGYTPGVLAVGASHNDHIFSTHVVINDGPPVVAVEDSGPIPSAPLSAPLVDMAAIDGNGMACGTLPAGSLNSSIVLILRGVCSFEQKLDAAQAAGAAGAIVYTDEARPDAIPMAVGAATLPAMMVSYSDGIAIKKQITGMQKATLDFTLTPGAAEPARLADFTAMGPNIDLSIKPDLTATGTDLYMATQSYDPNGEMYDAGGYTVADGTSFAGPLVAGAAALLKSARPGLTVQQYGSLLVNSTARASLTPGTGAGIQQAGSGLLDVSAALNLTATASPWSLSFGASSNGGTITRSLQVTNIGTSDDTFTISAQATTGGAVPTFDSSTVAMLAGSSKTLTVSFPAAGLSPGTYEGFIMIQGANASTPTKVPYWYAVPASSVNQITLLYVDDPAPVGGKDTDAVVFRINDSSGLPVSGVTPTASLLSGSAATSVAVRSRDNVYPGAWSLDIVFTRAAGTTVVRIQAGGVSQDVTISSQ